jgi:hypothetical protein
LYSSFISDAVKRSNLMSFLLYAYVQEALNMVMPAMQLASKIPDVHVQLWASALLKGIFPFHAIWKFILV